MNTVTETWARQKLPPAYRWLLATVVLLSAGLMALPTAFAVEPDPTAGGAGQNPVPGAPGSSTYRVQPFPTPGVRRVDMECGQDSQYQRPGCGTARAEPESPPSAGLTLPMVSIFSSEPQQAVGSPVTLNWEVSNAESCVAGGGWTGAKHAGDGSESVNIAAEGPNTYTLTCGNGDSGFQVTRQVTVEGVVPPVSVSLTPSASFVQTNQTFTLSWNVVGGSACVASGAWSGTRSPSGGTSNSLSRSAAGTYTFVLTCENHVNGTSASDSATVTVSSPPPPPPPPCTATGGIVSGPTGVMTSGGPARNVTASLSGGFCSGVYTNSSSGAQFGVPMSASNPYSVGGQCRRDHYFYPQSMNPLSGAQSGDLYRVTCGSQSLWDAIP